MPTPAEQLERINQQYRFRYGGHPRITRDPELLDKLRADVMAVVTVTQEDATRQTELAALFTREAEAIREARAQGPGALVAHRLAERANACFNRYGRHFAGKSRGTRDPGLLSELLTDLDTVVQRMDRLIDVGETSVVNNRATAARNLELYRNERHAIAASRTAGTAPEQAARLATIANGQFTLYRTHFSSKPRVSRSVTLLDRIRGTLEGVRDEMRALKAAGLASTSNDGNIDIVTRHIDRLVAERPEIVATQSRAGTDQRESALGEAANAIFKQYRENFAGQDRRTRDLVMLDGMIEGLWYIAEQMDAFDQDDGSEANSRNLQLVTDNMRRYRSEYKLIGEAQPPTE